MKKKLFASFALLFFCSITLWGTTHHSDNLSIQEVRNTVGAVVNWQINAYPSMDKDRVWKSYGDLSWENGVFLSALASWAEYDKSDTLIKWYRNVCARNNHSLLCAPHSIYFADDLIVGLIYATHYREEPNPRFLHHTLARLEFIASHPSQASLKMGTPQCQDRWNWSDALYMAPTVFATYANLTGNLQLLHFMDKEYWASYEYLFDKEEELFYRDSNYFGKKEHNGKKVFWGRGNAWVVGGLAQLLPQLPDNFSSKPQYERLFKQLMQQLIKSQDDEGYWHASLLDPDSYPSPETSSTGFITFALWWGINNGILPQKKFLPAARKGWSALVKAVHPNGKLGWVQPVGADPQKVTYEMTEVYGAGAVALCGKEIIEYIRTHCSTK